MRHKPTQPYSGLTVVMSQPSRQDIHALLTGYAGVVFNNECLNPYTNRWRCDVRTSDTLSEGLLPETKGLLLLGDRAFHEWTDGSYKDYTLNEQRGTPLNTRFNTPTLASYSPQDVIDFQDYESRFNKHITEHEDRNDDREGDEFSEKKRHGRTSRSNFRHWLCRDTQKLLGAISRPEITVSKQSWKIRLYPNSEEIITVLNTSQGQYLYLDIETDSAFNILCVGINFSDSNSVYVIPWLRHTYQKAYSDIHRIIRSLVLAMQRNTVVIHNAMFDLFIMAWKYRLLPPRHIFDTMICQHRIFPEAEKSLGHCLTAWPTIWEPFHKDEGVFMPHNSIEEQQLWTYNAKDVYGMRLIHEAQMEEIQNRGAGMESSIKQAMKSIRPFLLMSLQGIEFDDNLRQQIIKDNDILLTNYLRAIKVLVGPNIDLLPTSSKSCIRYFHDALGYPIVGRKTETGAPSLDETNLLKLKLKNPHNVVIDFCIKYRQRVKESGQLNFNPWPVISPLCPQNNTKL